MYESFYGLNAKPFSMLPDPDFLYLSKKHRLALTMLEYTLMNNAGFCVISGEIGAGKTTLLRKLLATLEENITIGMITNTHQSFGELLDWVLSAFGIHQPGLSKVEMHQRFVDFLLEQYARNKTTLLIVDEAQNMSATTLEELRMLSNINSEKDLVLQVILAGQPDLKDTLRLPELKQFAQRISVDFHLDALDAFDTCHYIQHRLVTAGATDDIFTPDACRLIAECSGGVPRLINLLCDTALVYGFADQTRTIDADLIEEIVNERMEHSILPLVKIDKAKKSEQHDDGSFPWINPEGGTKGLKPVAEKKTVEKTVVGAEQASDDDVRTRAHSPPSRAGLPKSKATVAAVVTGNSGGPKQPVLAAAPATAKIPQLDMKDSVNKNHPSPVSAPRSRPADKRASRAGIEVAPASTDDGADKAGFGTRMTVFALLILALLLTMIAVTHDYEVVHSELATNELTEIEYSTEQVETEDSSEQAVDESSNEQAGIDMLKQAEIDMLKQAEIDMLKQDLSRVQQQAEELQRERDAALEKAREEEAQRLREAQAAQEAANREKAAIAAAELAAEKALTIEKQADALAKKQRLEQRRLLDERDQLEQELQRTESQQKLLQEQRKIIVLEWERLAKEKAKVEQAIPGWSDSE